MVSSVYSGFSDQTSSALRKPVFTCRTGNCTWSPFASLAVCASCRDATPHITTSTHNASAETSSGYTDGTRTVFSLPLNNITNWDPISHAESAGKNHGTRLRSWTSSMIMSAQGTVNGSDLYSFRNSTTFLLGFSILHASEDYLNGSVPWNSSHPYGTECGLEFCTNIYGTEIREGMLSEEILLSSAQRRMQSLLPDFSVGETEKCGPSWNQLTNNSLYYGYGGTRAVDRSDLIIYISEEDMAKHGISVWPRSSAISDRTLKSTISWMKGEFASEHFVWYKTLNDEAFSHFEDSSFWNQSAVASSLVNRPTLADTFGRVADSMTVWMRNLGYSQTSVYGTTSSWVLNTHVRWPFISFPIVTTLAGCVFCAVVILETRRLGLSPWRDSCLAIMAYGINDDLRDQLRRAGDTEKAGRNMSIKINDGEYGPGLVQH